MGYTPSPASLLTNLSEVKTIKGDSVLVPVRSGILGKSLYPFTNIFMVVASHLQDLSQEVLYHNLKCFAIVNTLKTRPCEKQMPLIILATWLIS